LSSSLLTSRQVPEQHAEDPEQVRPQAPQLATELFVSTQAPSQQAPLLQLAPAPHRQTPAVQVSPELQAGEQGMSVVQVPPMQTSAPLQAFPQKPQLAASLEVSTHVMPQQAPPGAQAPAPQRQVPSTQTSSSTHTGSHGGSTHIPSTQASPASHRLPQPPQASGFVEGSSMHMPSQQSAAPVQAGPVPQRQDPPEQTLACRVQPMSHAPQSVNELSVLTHASPQQVRPPPHGMSGPHSATQELPRQTVPVGQLTGHIGPASDGNPPASVRTPESTMLGPESTPSTSPPRAQPKAPIDSARRNNSRRDAYKVKESYRCNSRERS